MKLVTFLGFFLILFVRQVNAAPPLNFQTVPVVTTGIEGPSGFDIAPDGRIFILERTGEVKIVKDGQMLPTLFANLPSVASGDRGLIGIAFDPDFLFNHYVYFYYTGLDLYNRLVRFNASGDVGTEGPVEIFKTNSPSEQLHVGGTIRFGNDGKMYFAVGDNGYHPNAQDLTNPHGKILRINKDGSVPSDNPFFGQVGNNPAIWAYGFRNPWRFSFDSVTGRLYAGDVGEADWEEANLIIKGGNYGWPNSEGFCTSMCDGLINPLYAYSHDGGSAAITAGPVYRGTMFPLEYRGNFFFGDYAKGFIRRMVLNDQGTSNGVIDFDTNAGSVVDFKVGTDGSLYYLTYIPGALYNINYSTGNKYPIANATANVTKGVEPLSVTFSSNGSYDPDGSALTYAWDFGDGTTSTAANPVKIYTTKGKFTVLLRVSDGVNEAVSIPIVIQVGIPPTITMGSPANNSTFKAGDQIFYSANAIDGAGYDISEGDFTTEVLFHHQTHIHPFYGPVQGKTGSFSIPTTGEPSAEVWYEIKITATDTNGLSTTGIAAIYPQVVNLTLSSVPAGLQILLDGIPTDTGQVIPSIVGYQRVISPLDHQLKNGTYYQFQSWSDGGSAIHTYTIPATDSLLTATYQAMPAFVGSYYANRDLAGTPVLTRNDPVIDFFWDSGSPAPSLPSDGFSVSWSKTQYFAAGRYRFTVKSDDGARLFIDGQKIIDQWQDQATTITQKDIDLTSGGHPLVFDYYESYGGSIVKLDWEIIDSPTVTPTPPVQTPTPTPTIIPSGEGYTGEYFNNTSLGGSPVITRTDPAIDFVWNDGSPAPALPVDQFSVRWSRTLSLPAGTYTFTTSTDDGVRVFVDGAVIIDKWRDQGTTTYEGSTTLAAGNHQIIVEYYENYGGAVAKFSYIKTADTVPTPTPTPTVTPTPTPPLSADTYRGEYWKNAVTDGQIPTIPIRAPDLVKNDPTINFVVNDGAMQPEIGTDLFVVRWIKNAVFEAQTYRFTARADDGIRVYLDNTLLIDAWKDQAATTYEVDAAVTAGSHQIKVEYYERYGGSVVIMSYQSSGVSLPTPTPTPTVTPTVPPAVNGFLGEYWNTPGSSSSPDLPSRPPDLSRTDPAINFVLNDGSPAPTINPDHFVARWTRNETFAGGNYTFTLKSDDGIRFWVDGVLLVNDWTDHGMRVYAPNVDLASGSHLLKVEYYENSGGAVAILEYTP